MQTAAIGILAKDENECGKEEGKKQFDEFTTHPSSFILHLHLIGYPSVLTIPLRPSYYPVAQTEVKIWPKEPYLERLTKQPNQQDRRMF